MAIPHTVAARTSIPADLKPPLSVAFMGHVDTGKSTIIGHLLYQCGCITEQEKQRLFTASEELGKASFAYAWYNDTTRDERERGITIRYTERLLFTPKYAMTIVDVPGHRKFMQNTIAGIASSDCGVLVVAATEGEYEAGMAFGGQTKEHVLVAAAMGIKQLIVAVNKIDIVTEAQSRFNEIKTELGAYLATVGFQEQDITFVPVSGWHGMNLVPGSQELTWNGPSQTLLDALDSFTVPRRCSEKPLRFPVHAVYKISGIGTVVASRVEAGVLIPGMQVQFAPRDIKGTVFSIESHHRQLDKALPGTPIGINLEGVDAQQLERGCVGSSVLDDPAKATSEFTAQVVFLNHSCKLFQPGYTPVVHCHSTQVTCRISRIVSKLDRQTGDVIEKEPKAVKTGDACVIELQPTAPAVFEPFRHYPRLGRIVIRDGGRTIGVGVVRSVKKVVKQNWNAGSSWD